MNPPPTLTWLGARPRRTLWRTSTDSAECLGWITPHGDTWAAYLPPETVDGPFRRLRSCDDETAAARALCAFLRVGDVALPTLTDESGES